MASTIRTRPLLASTLLAAAALSLAPSTARADAATAQVLFDEGKRLMDQKKYEAACPKFEESLKQDEKIGTQFQLANCQELVGKTASSWTNFLEVAGKAKARGEAEREQVARERAKALEGKLSRLRIVVTAPEKSPGMTIRRDGNEIGQASWGVAVPVDPGAHIIEAMAPGRSPWKGTIDVANPGSTVTATVPELKVGSGYPQGYQPGYTYQPGAQPGYPPGYTSTPLPPVRRTKRASPALFGTGIALISLGGVALVAGALVALTGGVQNASGSTFGDGPSDDGQGTVDTGVAMVVGGLAGIAVGIPLTVIGNRKVPVESSRWYKPTRVGVGPGQLSATWTF